MYKSKRELLATEGSDGENMNASDDGAESDGSESSEGLPMCHSMADGHLESSPADSLKDPETGKWRTGPERRGLMRNFPLEGQAAIQESSMSGRFGAPLSNEPPSSGLDAEGLRARVSTGAEDSPK